MKIKSLVILLLIFSALGINAKDTSIVFKPVKPLIDSANLNFIKRDYAGFVLGISNHGFSFGGYYSHEYSKIWSLYTNLQFGGAKNGDEYEYWDYERNQYVIRNKVNRLFLFPLSIGVQARLFAESLSESFKPFVNLGIAPSLIISTPYSKEFFSSFGKGRFYYRMGYFGGFGANFGAGKNNIGIHANYYYIPFGGSGLESIQGRPLKDFGGAVLSLTIGGAL